MAVNVQAPLDNEIANACCRDDPEWSKLLYITMMTGCVPSKACLFVYGQASAEQHGC